MAKGGNNQGNNPNSGNEPAEELTGLQSEEGGWPVGITGVELGGGQRASYLRIGGWVFIEAWIHWNSRDASANDVEITGIPYVPTTAGVNGYVGDFRILQGVSFDSGMNKFCRTASSTSLKVHAHHGTYDVTLKLQDLQSVGQMYISLSYETNQDFME